jgi:hypothetical protein
VRVTLLVFDVVGIEIEDGFPAQFAVREVSAKVIRGIH